MAPLNPTAAAALLLLGTCQAHFVLKLPQPVGTLQEEKESNSPCGGYTPDFSSDTVSNFMVGGDAIATQSSHPQTTYLYRITTDEKASGNWTQIHHIVQQSGINTFCVPTVTVPESYVGQTGVLSIVADGEDGLLYQCAAVKFVSGSNSNIPSSCTNSSGVTGSEVDDSALSALVSGTTSSSNSSANGTTSGTGSTASATSTSKPNAGTATYGSLEGMRGLVSILSVVLVGAGLMI